MGVSHASSRKNKKKERKSATALAKRQAKFDNVCMRHPYATDDMNKMDHVTLETKILSTGCAENRGRLAPTCAYWNAWRSHLSCHFVRHLNTIHRFLARCISGRVRQIWTLKHKMTITSISKNGDTVAKVVTPQQFPEYFAKPLQEPVRERTKSTK